MTIFEDRNSLSSPLEQWFQTVFLELSGLILLLTIKHATLNMQLIISLKLLLLLFQTLNCFVQLYLSIFDYGN